MNNPSENYLIESDAEALLLHLQTHFDSLNQRSEQLNRRSAAMPYFVSKSAIRRPLLYFTAVGIAAAIAIIICTTCIVPPKHYDASTLQSITLILNQI